MPSRVQAHRIFFIDWMSQQLNNNDVKEHCYIDYDLTLSFNSFPSFSYLRAFQV